MENLILVLAFLQTCFLVRGLTKDNFACVLGGAVYALGLPTRYLMAHDPRLAICACLLPGFLVVFYRTLTIAVDEEFARQRRSWGILAVCLAFFGVLDTRFAVMAGLLVWLILSVGYLLDLRRRSAVWGPPFKGWALTCVAALILYFPLWWWRRLHPGAMGGLPARIADNGADFIALWYPTPAYFGVIAFLLALVAMGFSRSYRGPVRLWVIIACLMFWARLGGAFILQGKYFWWVPVLYRGLARLPWLKKIEPPFFGAVGQLALAILTAYGFSALMARLSPRLWRLRWVRPALTIVLAALIVIDNLR